VRIPGILKEKCVRMQIGPVVGFNEYSNEPNKLQAVSISRRILFPGRLT
jgi:hypothetical protein